MSQAPNQQYTASKGKIFLPPLTPPFSSKSKEPFSLRADCLLDKRLGQGFRLNEHVSARPGPGIGQHSAPQGKAE
jgi:hypothetical protein